MGRNNIESAQYMTIQDTTEQNITLPTLLLCGCEGMTSETDSKKTERNKAEHNSTVQNKSPDSFPGICIAEIN